MRRQWRKRPFWGASRKAPMPGSVYRRPAFTRERTDLERPRRIRAPATERVFIALRDFIPKTGNFHRLSALWPKLPRSNIQGHSATRAPGSISKRAYPAYTLSWITGDGT